MELASDPAWLGLGHYRPAGGPDPFVSRIDDERFFVAKGGRSSPEAELQATIDAFFSDDPRFEEPAQCRLKARYEWLKAKLDFDSARLPEQACTRLDAWLQGLNVESMAVVFAANDLGGPSTMFGHTLLRLDARGQGDDQRLLAYAVNYSAYTGPDAGLLYALKGLYGFYKGYFGLFPYYEKVKEYVRIEQRDLWEYPLALSFEQRHALLMHFWELRGIGSDYYFFSDNCSYALLMALRTASPDVSLDEFEGFFAHAIPADTIRTLARDGLVGEPNYRPSSAASLRAHARTLSLEQLRWVIRYATVATVPEDATLDRASTRDQARMLQLAHDLLYHRFQAGDLSREDSLPKARAALARLSKLSGSPEFPAVAASNLPPDKGHASGRANAGLRLTKDGEVFGLFGLRPAYHDRLDPPQGYLAGGEIEFLSGQISVGDEHLRLDHLSLLKVEAVAPRDELFQPWSWFAALGADPVRPLAHDPGAIGGFADGGGGLAWAPAPALQAYAFGMFSLQANEDLRRGHDVAGGLRLGLASQRWSPLTAELQGEWLGGLAGAATERQRLRAELQWNRGVADGLRLGWRLDRRDGVTDSAPEIRWMHYF